ncbi:enoyl-CoA hydratase/isomerase family protein [Devosia sp.]|uniref:enoyl-CoA hydratase/isomerase family protein n=1 Tax=Devosia sp. TaxID=1871048 RepID=UPI003A8F889A
MTDLVEITRAGRMGVITLNRPGAINALNREMVDAISATLTAWQADDGVALVLFTGRGPKGFCAGGDVRAVRQAIIDGRVEDAHAYFSAEYAMNGLIATYPKPIVVLAAGIVMGGGIGIAGHCRYRVTTPEARFAMPEAAIGFFSDVGVNAIVRSAPQQHALPWLMAGLPVGAGDAVALGLTDWVVPLETLQGLEAELGAAASGADVEAGVRAAIAAVAIAPGAADYCAAADQLPRSVDWHDPAAIMAAIADEPALSKLAAALPVRSPTALAAIVVAHQAARQLDTVQDILAFDLRMAQYLSRLPDFSEGVRAVLVDKDQTPRWRPDSLAEVDRQALENVSAFPRI